MTATVTDPAGKRYIGIDLGTTNSALAWTDARHPIRVLDVPQLSEPGETRAFPTLPSFLYFPTDAEQRAGIARLPWNESPGVVAGVFARDHGALVPARQVSSAKSWLVHAAVDRTAPLLPWGFEEGPRVSPVEASALLLSHLRDAWNSTQASPAGTGSLERQQVVLTVPASFDEEARELTVQAARDAGLVDVILIEEPVAALYAWIASHRRQTAAHLSGGSLVLVCDVGGGTTDFSLVRATAASHAPAPVAADRGSDTATRVEDRTGVQFERIAIGEHLLLGGDNVDLALAAVVERKLAQPGAPRLTLAQHQVLRRKCSAAKEQLLSTAGPERVRITLLGAGRDVVGGGRSADLTRDEALATLTDGFLPITRPDDLPARDRRMALRELGLPFESEPAITRHLAAFLSRAGRDAPGRMLRPDAVLFNGGFFTPAVARERILDALAAWFGERPAVLENDRPEAAVAVGAAFYARLREDPDAARRLLIRAGSARAYYIALEAQASGATTAVCVMPRGTQEGTALTLDRVFSVTTNQPAAFTLFSSTLRSDAANDIVSFGADEEVHRHAPLVTVLRYGKRSRRVPLSVRLRVAFTETGTLELWCESQATEHRWRLAFNLRAAEADALDASVSSAGEEPAAGSDEAVIGAESVASAVQLITAVFGEPIASVVHPSSTQATPAVPLVTSTAGLSPEALVGEIEATLGFGKHAWPLGVIRQLADALLAHATGRTRSPAHEVRWLNLVGFCIRPGFGTPLDAWRISELRKVYAAGLAFPKEIQNQVEWLVLWQRVSGGFSAGHQRELAQRVMGQLGIGQRKPAHVNAQIEREAWRLLGSLERLDAGQRTNLGDELLKRIRREPRNRAWLWTIGRLGARVPFYGPLNSIVPAAVAERWIEAVLSKQMSEEAAEAVAQIGARTEDRARDLSEEVRLQAIARLRTAGIRPEIVLPLAELVPRGRLDTVQIFGESLPQGLRLER